MPVQPHRQTDKYSFLVTSHEPYPLRPVFHFIFPRAAGAPGVEEVHRQTQRQP